mgnify:CR=1 FL=1
MSAYSRQTFAALSPTTGIFSTNSGGCGSFTSENRLVQSTISLALATMVPIAAENGTTKTSSSAAVMMVVASQRLPQRRDWSARRIGHVVTTIIAAQMVAARNGRRIQTDAAMSPPMIRTAKTVRVRSRVRGSCSMMVANSSSSGYCMNQPWLTTSDWPVSAFDGNAAKNSADLRQRHRRS